jgi:hypothetical protein
MPSKPKSSGVSLHPAFIPLVVVSFLFWVIYRSIFHFDVWFDEIIGKALFFGLPVWLYIHLSGSTAISDSFGVNKLHSGLMTGIAIGGLFGFAASLVGLWQAGGAQAALVFTSQNFWWEFLLALFTGFWETIFFFSWIMIVLQEKYSQWSLTKQVLIVAAVFLLFHLPNTLLRFSGAAVISQLILLFLFALGQALFFARRRNGYALVLSHAIWGMVLLIHLT